MQLLWAHAAFHKWQSCPCWATGAGGRVAAALLGPGVTGGVHIHCTVLCMTSLPLVAHRHGFDGFLRSVQRHYAVKAAAAEAAAQEHLAGVCSWHATASGMFLWFELKCMPDADLMNEHALQLGVACVLGRFFSAQHALIADGQQKPDCPYFRVSFAGLSGQQMDEGFRRLRLAIDRAAAARPATAGAATLHAPQAGV